MTEGLIGDKVSQVAIDYWITHHEYGRRAHLFMCWMADEISKLPCITRNAADIGTLESVLCAKWVGVSRHEGFRQNLYCTLFDLCMNPSQLDGLNSAVPTGFVAYWRID